VRVPNVIFIILVFFVLYSQNYVLIMEKKSNFLV
jgi:hypothetical protein